MSWLDRVSRWFRLVVDQRRSFIAARVDDAPDVLDEGVVYLIGDSPKPWAALFLCPCGCGDTVSLSLMPTDRPSWRARIQVEGSITLSPSIRRTKGCRSHFFVRNGRVLWVKAAVEHANKP